MNKTITPEAWPDDIFNCANSIKNLAKKAAHFLLSAITEGRPSLAKAFMPIQYLQQPITMAGLISNYFMKRLKTG